MNVKGLGPKLSPKHFTVKMNRYMGSVNIESISDRKIICSLFLVTFLISCIPGLFLKTPFFSDEIGTLGNAAALSGYNWETLLRGNGAYYKYGQSLLYFPLFLILDDSSMIFKGVEIVNAFLISGVTPISYILINKCFQVRKKDAITLSFLVGILPSSLLISKYAWAESVLLLTPWLVLISTVFACKAEGKSKKVYSCLASISAGYAFMAHQRGIVIVIALVLTVLLIRLYYKENIFDWGYFLLSLFVMLILDRCLSIFFRDLSFGSGAVITANTLGSSLDFTYLSKIFTPYGFWILIKGISGWLFALTVETYGLILLGIFFFVYKIMMILKLSERKFKPEIILYVFAGLIVAGAFSMGIMFFYKSIYQYYLWEEIWRADRLIYTRYVDSALGPLCLIALFELKTKLKDMHWKAKLSLLGVFGLLIVFYYRYVMGIIDSVTVWLHALLGVGFFINSAGYEQGFVEVEYLSKLILFAALFSFVIFCGILLLKNRKLKTILLASIFFSTYICCFYNITYKVNRHYSETAITVANTVGEFTNIDEKYKYIYCATGDMDLFREALQFHLKDYQLIRSNYLYDADCGVDLENMFIFAKSYDLELYNDDFYEIEGITTLGEYKFYIKGEKLNQEVRKNGIKTQRIIL